MNLEDAIKSRKSVRKCSDKKVDIELLKKIISAGNYAPSHCNTQAWRFIVVDDPVIQDKIFKFGGSPIIKEAPAGILVLYNTATSDNLEYQDWIQSGSAAIQNMMLTIHDLGLGGCWVCHLPRKKELNKIFNIQKPYSPIAYIILGHPLQETLSKVPRKKEVDEIFAVNKYIWLKEKTPFKIHQKRITKKIYFLLPAFIKKLMQPMADKLTKKFDN